MWRGPRGTSPASEAGFSPCPLPAPGAPDAHKLVRFWRIVSSHWPTKSDIWREDRVWRDWHGPQPKGQREMEGKYRQNEPSAEENLLIRRCSYLRRPWGRGQAAGAARQSDGATCRLQVVVKFC
ncbi:hypothetical protein TGPRC2_229730 [Toxoplasma gondii TgCatPRC2]|uniref:Uncharacterized protein n=1 Tax=Toxoplasma gondii TgCatPRC2 TaxID=1130821 RepID=A0A151HEA5_TOXGO|nr:hypothetical protein TGPRC2_229730 [Toxoplasma gondii TgCatPRC2]